MSARLSALLPRSWISLATIVVLIVAWEIVAHAMPTSPLQDAPFVPPWEYVFGRAFIGMSDYWKVDRWAPVPELGGAQTLLGAVLALGYHSVASLVRLSLGLAAGACAGVFVGLALSWSPVLRQMAAAPLHLLRMTPLLAMIPMFQFWFGAGDVSAILFVAYGVAVPFVLATVNAVTNVPNRYIESALTLGYSRAAAYRHVVFPAILPELFSTVFMTLGLAWSAVIGAEYIGAESGLGRIVIWADFFSNTGRMVLVTIVIVVLAGSTFFAAEAIRRRLLRWMPEESRTNARLR